MILILEFLIIVCPSCGMSYDIFDIKEDLFEKSWCMVVDFYKISIDFENIRHMIGISLAASKKIICEET